MESGRHTARLGEEGPPCPSLACARPPVRPARLCQDRVKPLRGVGREVRDMQGDEPPGAETPSRRRTSSGLVSSANSSPA